MDLIIFYDDTEFEYLTSLRQLQLLNKHKIGQNID